MKLTPEDLEKLKTKQLANIIRKLGEGKTITAREQRLLDESRSTSSGEDSVGPNFALTWDELARVLTQRLGVSVSRKSVQNWRNPRRRPDLAEKWPRDRADGRKDVSAWMRFVIENGLNRADEVVGGDEIEGEERNTVRDWKIYREELQCIEAERRIARLDNLLLVATDLEIPIGSMLAAINSKLNLYPPRAARFMVMKRDVADAEITLRDEMDAVIKDLNLADYIDAPIEEIANELSTDPEIIREALRRIGRRALSQHQADDEPPAPTSRDREETPLAPQSEVEAPKEGKAQPKSEHVTRPRKRAGKAKRTKR